MNHGLTNDYLYAAYRIEAGFKDDLGKTKSISGTAFFVKNKKNEICLLTNRHVLDLDYNQSTTKYKQFKLISVTIHNKLKDKSTELPTDSDTLLIINHRELIFSSKPENDVVCLKDVKVLSVKGKSPIIEFFIDYSMIANKERINEKLTVCDFVAFPGFPEWYDKGNNLPILRTGTIASDPRFNYSYDKNGIDKGEIIAYEAFSFEGSSGSPIFAIEKGIKLGSGLIGGNYREPMLIGINGGHLPIQEVKNTHSGISYFYKSSIIIELIDG